MTQKSLGTTVLEVFTRENWLKGCDIKNSNKFTTKSQEIIEIQNLSLMLRLDSDDEN